MFFPSELQFHTWSSRRLVLKLKFMETFIAWKKNTYYDVPQRANYGKEQKIEICLQS